MPYRFYQYLFFEYIVITAFYLFLVITAKNIIILRLFE